MKPIGHTECENIFNTDTLTTDVSDSADVINLATESVDADDAATDDVAIDDKVFDDAVNDDKIIDDEVIDDAVIDDAVNDIAAEQTPRCKNCGSPCDTAYCGVCGQSMSVERLQPRQFFVDMLSGLLRINRGFLFTAKHLVIHPWKVIRDYVQGRRISYTPPVNLLVLLSFIGTIITGVFMPESSAKEAFEMPADSSLFYRIGVSIGDFFANSTIATNLTVYLPALLAIPLVYRSHGSKRYNIAEYFVAMIYMACSFMIFRILTSPLHVFFPDFDLSTVNMTYAVLISGASLYIAFPMTTRKARVTHFIYYLLSAFALYLVLAIFLGLGITWLLEQ